MVEERSIPQYKRTIGTVREVFGITRSILLIKEVRDEFRFRYGKGVPSSPKTRNWRNQWIILMDMEIDMNYFKERGRSRPQSLEWLEEIHEDVLR